MNDNPTTRFGLIGLGRIGRSHVKMIEQTSGIELTAVCDPSAEALATCDSRYRRYEDYHAMLADSVCDVVVIATPSHLHHTMAMAALHAGVNVLVEKPVTTTYAEARELAETAQSRGLFVTVDQKLRYQADTQMVKKIIDSGQIGDVLQVYRAQHGVNERKDWQIWKKYNGGALSNLGTHLVDTLLHVSGAEPQAVFGACHRVIDQGDTEDQYKVVIACRGGVVLETEGLRAGHGKAFWHVCGTKGSLYAEDDLPELVIRIETFDGVSQTQTYDFSTETQDVALVKLYEDLADHLGRRLPPPITIQSVCTQMRVIEGARQSSRDQTLVALDPDEAAVAQGV